MLAQHKSLCWCLLRAIVSKQAPKSECKMQHEKCQTFWPCSDECPEMPTLPTVFLSKQTSRFCQLDSKALSAQVFQIFCQRPSWFSIMLKILQKHFSSLSCLHVRAAPGRKWTKSHCSEITVIATVAAMSYYSNYVLIRRKRHHWQIFRQSVNFFFFKSNIMLLT